MIAPDPYSVPMAPDAEELFDQVDLEQTARLRGAIGTNRSAILARVWENTAKIALIKAVSANPQAPIIRLEDAEWARLVVDRCVATMMTEAERHIADNQVQADHQRVLRLIQGAGERGLPRSVLTRNTQFLERKKREDIVSALIEGGDVTLEEQHTAGRTAQVYRAVVR